MNRSLMIISVMGMVALVMMAGLGSFFVGKIGGAENVSTLKGELMELYSFCLASGREYDVKVRMSDGRSGLLISFQPERRIAEDHRRLERQLRKIAGYVFGHEAWVKRAEYVSLKLTGETGKGREATIARPPRIIPVKRQ